MFLLQTLHRLTTAERRQMLQGGKGVDDEQFVEAIVVADEPAGSETANASALAEDPSALDMPQGDVLAKHTRTVFRCWVVLFALVGAQMGWVLRPFIGSPQLPFTWFRERHSNFFAGVLRALGELLFGGN